MRSMTGYGRGEAPLGEGRLSVELRSVNHRFLDLRVRTPRELVDHGVYVESLARARLSRGRVDVAVHCEGVSTAGWALDRPKARAALEAFSELSREMGIPGPVPLSVLSSMPELFTPVVELDPEAVREALLRAMTTASAALDRAREEEGRHLAVDLAQRADAVGRSLDAIADGTEGMVGRLRERFVQRVKSLLEGVGRGGVDPARLELELALLCDRSDVTEELTRLRAHLAHCRELLSGAEPSGRKLDFVLQEMGREANTLGAKAVEADVARRVVELKSEVERMREQAQNVE